jgi:hypothetical protein
LSGIKYPKSKKEIIDYMTSSPQIKVKKELIDLIQNLPERTYRDSAEVAIALGEIKSGKKIRRAKEVEKTESLSKKRGKVAATSSISAATLAKALSGIDLPQSQENISKHVNKNVVNMKKDIQTDIMKIFRRLPKKEYKDMAEIEIELSKIL